MDDRQTARPSFSGLPLFGRSRAASSAVALRCATAFILFAGALSFLAEPHDNWWKREGSMAASGQGSWRLRGTLAPEETHADAAQLPAVAKHV